MKWSFATVGIFLLGIIGVSIILLFQEVTTNNENDYYLLKEVTEASMLDAVDVAYYRKTGNLKIVKEKFVENFTRRFAESTIFVTNDYNIEFYDIMEVPPKVSIIIHTEIGEYTVAGNADDYNIANKLDAILEYTGKNTDVSPGTMYYNNPYVKKTMEIDNYYAIIDNSKDNIFSLKVPDVLNAPNIKNITVDSVKNIGVGKSQGDLNQVLMRNELLYNNVSSSSYLLSINSYNGEIENVSFDVYNCSDGYNNYKCDDINKYYIKINGKIKGKLILKYKVIWSYDEYEFVN